MPAAAQDSHVGSRTSAHSDTVDAGTEGARIERYRRAERTLAERYGVEPAERFIEVGSPAVRLRVREVGSGEPVLLVHGTGGPGTWPSLVGGLEGFRCIMLDRPGWGLSSPVDFSARDYGATVADLLCGVLDALEVDRAHAVGASIGNTWALRLAQRHPARVGRVVLLGGGPLLPGVDVPVFIRLLASPAGAVIVRVPQKRRMIVSQMRAIGHGASLDAGRIPEEFLDWRLSMSRDTASMRHEREMVRAIVSPRGFFRAGLTFAEGELARIEQPVLHVFGTADPIGTVETWRRMAGRLPRGELYVVDDAGHVPWFEQPELVARELSRFLGA